MLQLDDATASSLTTIAALAYLEYHLQFIFINFNILSSLIYLDFVLCVQYLLALRSFKHLHYQCSHFFCCFSFVSHYYHYYYFDCVNGIIFVVTIATKNVMSLIYVCIIKFTYLTLSLIMTVMSAASHLQRSLSALIAYTLNTSLVHVRHLLLTMTSRLFSLYLHDKISLFTVLF